MYRFVGATASRRYGRQDASLIMSGAMGGVGQPPTELRKGQYPILSSVVRRCRRLRCCVQGKPDSVDQSVTPRWLCTCLPAPPPWAAPPT